MEGCRILMPVQDSVALKAQARRLGFESLGVCAPEPPPHLAAYREWLERGYHGEMDYLRRHLAFKADPAKLLPGVRSVIAVSLNYNQSNEPREGLPRIARYALGRDYHKVLRSKLRKLANWIGADSESHRICVDSAPIMERDYAQLAGLGWFGKNTMLIDSRRGSWFFIGILLTTVEFERDRPATGGCGSCGRCIDACPTGAIVFDEGRWQVDARRCISYQTIERRGELEHDTAGWTFGCDVCQEVCPFNEPRRSQPRRAAFTTERDFLARREWPSLERLAMIEEREWDLVTRGSAVRRAGLGGLRRNARAALESH